MANHSIKSTGTSSLMKVINTIIIPVIAVAALGLAGYFYMQVRTLNAQVRTFKDNPQIIAQQETDSLVNKVSKLMVLPMGETPTIATVTDPAALKDQPFFASAQKDDKVLIYAQAKKAILYSVQLDKILEIAPLNLGENAPTTTGKTTK